MSELTTNIPELSSSRATSSINNDNASRSNEFDKREVEQTPPPAIAGRDQWWDRLGQQAGYETGDEAAEATLRGDKPVTEQRQQRRASDLNRHIGDKGVTRESVAQQADALSVAWSTAQTMYENNEISYQQYAEAQQEASIYFKNLQELDIAAKHNELSARQAQQAFHDQLGEILPEWQKESNRHHVTGRLTNFLSKYGFSEQDLKSISDPRIIGFIAKIEKQLRPNSKALSQVRQNQADKRVRGGADSHNNEVGYSSASSVQGKVDRISELLDKSSRVR
jgi:hypothetical protein